MITSTHIQIDEHRHLTLTHDGEEDDGVYLEVRDEDGDASVTLTEEKINELFTAVTILKTRQATVRNRKERAQ